MPPALITPDSQGRLIFGADDAILHGDQFKPEEQDGKPNIGFWDKFSTAYLGTVQIKQAGDFLACLCFQPFNFLSPAEMISF
jgi:hypothetical protein